MNTTAMPAAERCLAAILDFWMRVPESRGNDPMWYYTNQLTANPSSPPSWNGGLCDYNPVYLSNTSCQCDAAKQWYTTKYPESSMHTIRDGWKREQGAREEEREEK